MSPAILCLLFSRVENIGHGAADDHPAGYDLPLVTLDKFPRGIHFRGRAEEDSDEISGEKKDAEMGKAKKEDEFELSV